MKSPLSPLLALFFTPLVLCAQPVFPYPSEWTSPVGSPGAEGGWTIDQLGTEGTKPVPGSPVISEWHRTVKPGESFVLSGANFTEKSGEDAGKDTKIWIMGQKGIRPADVLTVESTFLAAILPEDLPLGVYFVFVENAKGIGAPVPINRATPEWVGPLGASASPGSKKRVFGRNLSKDLGTTDSRVFLKSDSSASFVEARVTAVEPYSVEFEIPADLPDGTYSLFVDNSQGGQFGLAGGIALEVNSKIWQRGSRQLSLEPSGVDDTESLQASIDDLSKEENGGTLRLSSGTYVITAPLTISENVQIIGAGMDKTRLEVRLEKNVHSAITLSGNHISVSDLSIHLSDTGYLPKHRLFGSNLQGGGTDDLTIRNLKWTSDPTISEGTVVFFGKRIEVTGVHAERNLGPRGSDFWIHNNNFWGSPYFGASSEAGLSGAVDLSVIEKNHYETRNWPKNEEGSRQYREFISREDLKPMIWQKRLVAGFPMRNTYIAHNTSKNVATQDNRGEMILFHEVHGRWMGKVKSSSDTILTLDESPELDGMERKLTQNDTTVPFGGTIPNLKVTERGFFDHEFYAVIVRGPGFGQARRIIDQNGSKVTLLSPWRVPPTAESLVVLTPLYYENIIYKNELNAFPEDYVLTDHSASNGIQYDGNCWRNVAEGNVSRRTSSGRKIGGRNLNPTYWNDFRDETAENIRLSSGIMIMTGGSIISPASFANTFRGGRYEVESPNSAIVRVCSWFEFTNEITGMPEHPVHFNLANIVEGTAGSAPQLGILEEERRNHGLQDPDAAISKTLYIRNRFTLTGADPKPVSLSPHSYPTMKDNLFLNSQGNPVSPDQTDPVQIKN